MFHQNRTFHNMPIITDAFLFHKGFARAVNFIPCKSSLAPLTLITKLSTISLNWYREVIETDYMAELAAIAQEHGGIIETKTAIAHGISKAMLSKLCREEKIHRIVQGQYILPDNMQDELLSISKRSNQIILSHETALFLHGISDRTPFEHTITVPSDYTVSAAIKNECKVYYIKPDLFEIGRTTLNTPVGSEVPVYDLERTICDMIRSRSKVGTETFLAALKLYAASPKKDLNKLHSYAKKMRVANVLRQYLEVLL